MNTIRQKKRILFRAATIYFLLLFLIITMPQTVQVFDRNDIWIMGLPLAQFFIILISALATAGMIVLYKLEKRIEQGGRDSG